MSLLSDLPDDILNLISIRLNGFDNCSLWMASDSILRQRLVNNVITDFDIKYTTPGRYLWPGNFLKKLQKLSRLSLVVDDSLYHIPIENVHLYLIPTLKYLRVFCNNANQIFESTSSNQPTDPTPTSTNKYLNLNDFYPNLEHLEIQGGDYGSILIVDFLRFLPQNLQALSIPQNRFHIYKENPEDHAILDELPHTLTSLDLIFGFQVPVLDFSKLSPNFTSLSTNASIDIQSSNMIPRTMEHLRLSCKESLVKELSTFLPTGLRSLSLDICGRVAIANTLSHLVNLEKLALNSVDSRLIDLFTECPPNLKEFSGRSIRLSDSQSRPFVSGMRTINLTRASGVTQAFIGSLPETLTNLSISHIDQRAFFAFFTLLPKNLTSFTSNLEIVEATSLLPDSLTSLCLYPQDQNHVAYFNRLPPKLESLTLIGNIPQTLFKGLPDTLKLLYISTEALILDDEVIAMLPRGLTSLKLVSRDSDDEITDECDFPAHLESLTIQYNRTMTDEVVKRLPRSLTYLSLPNNPNFTDECIKHLPRNLIFLDLSASKTISSRSRKDLPTYLHSLYLQTSKNWDQAAVRDLPPYLNEFHVANMSANLAWTDQMPNIKHARF